MTVTFSLYVRLDNWFSVLIVMAHAYENWLIVPLTEVSDRGRRRPEHVAAGRALVESSAWTLTSPK